MEPSAQLLKELMCGWSDTDAPPIPGGFGAVAGPNDGWHQAYHSLAASYNRVAIGFGSELQLRKQLDQLSMSLQSAPQTKYLSQNGTIHTDGSHVAYSILLWSLTLHVLSVCSSLYMELKLPFSKIV